ncbi:MAG: sigma-54 dependent transcriptional regulator [Acidobacteriota bacterium]
MKKILIAEDEKNLREGIARALMQAGWDVVEAENGNEAIKRIEEQVFDVVLTDYKMPAKNGLEILHHSKMINESTAVIVMTAFGTVENAVEAMKKGAFDYIQKPFNIDEIELRVDRAIQQKKILDRVNFFDRQRSSVGFSGIVGDSAQMKKIFKMIEKIAPSNTTVLITGETGTGKELIAEAIHKNSTRKEGPFVKTNCAALHENLLESELFGHERGAFTGADRQRIGRFELASGGTLFLDEIANMSASTQAKVLRVMQEMEFERLGGTRTIKVDIRMIAATNRNLEEAIEKKEFREDLYYRLNVVNITVPPLRERKDDIVPLVNHFINIFSRELKKDIRGISPAALNILQRHTWPGNIRELENTIERAILMAEGKLLETSDLAIAAAWEAKEQAEFKELRLPPTGIKLDDLEKQAILEALRMNDWVQKNAASFLGLSSRVMNYKVQKYNIKNPRWNKNKPE